MLFHIDFKTGKPAYLPVALHARTNGIAVNFTDALDPASAADAQNYAVKVWSLKRSEQYGSPHLGEHSLSVAKAILAGDRKSVFLELPDIQPTWCMEIKCALRGADGSAIDRRIHNTVHQLGAVPTGPAK